MILYVYVGAEHELHSIREGLLPCDTDGFLRHEAEACVFACRNTKLWICMEFCGGGSLQDIYHGTNCVNIQMYLI